MDVGKNAREATRVGLICGGPMHGSALLEISGPVHNGSERTGGPVSFVDNHEAQAIRAYVVTAENAVRVGVKEHTRSSGRKATARSFHFYGHQFIVRRQIEDFLAVATPERSASVAKRDLPFSARPRKGDDVDAILARLIRAVGQPFSVGREAGFAGAEGRLDERISLAVAKERQDPYRPASRNPVRIRPSGNTFVIDEKFSVGGPGGRDSKVVDALQKKRFAARAVGRLLVKAVLTVAIRGIGNVLSVRGPHRIQVPLSGRRTKSQRDLYATRDIETPYVHNGSIKIIGELFAFPRCGDARVSIIPWHRSDLLPVAIEPNQLAILGRTFGVKKHSICGRREPGVGNAGILQHFFGDRDGFSFDLETFRVKGLGHQGGLAQEEQMPGCIGGLVVSVKKKLGLLGIERTHEDRVGGAFAGSERASGQEDEMTPVGQERGPAVGGFVLGRILRRELRNGAPGGRYAVDGRIDSRRENNIVLLIPGSPAPIRSIADNGWRTTAGINFLQLASGKKANVPAVRRPEGKSGGFCSRQQSSMKRIHWTNP